MSTNLQDLDSIAPMNQGAPKDDDPVRMEYEQGKRSLESGEFGQAAVSLHNAMVGFEENGDELGVANSAFQLSKVCLGRNDFDNAALHLAKAERIVAGKNDLMSVLAITKQFILVYSGAGQYKEAVEKCLDALDIYHTNNDPRGSIDIMEQMADVYIQAGDPAKAADVYRTIASIHRNFKHDNLAQEFLAKADKLA